MDTPPITSDAELNPTEALDDETAECETCRRTLTETEVEDFGDECQACHDTRHFTCAGCGDEFEYDDVSPDHPGLCDGCGQTLDEERLERLKDRLRELVDKIIDTDDEAFTMRVLDAVCKTKRRVK